MQIPDTLFTRINVICLSLALLLLSPCAVGLSSDKDAPVELEADSADINQKTGTTIYQGRVKVTQGSMILTADKVVIDYKDNKAHKFTATGTPARFQQLPDNEETPIKGKGQTILYLIKSEELVLTGDAELHQGGDRFSSDKIVYDRVKAQLKAGSAAQGSERVRVTIQPDKLK